MARKKTAAAKKNQAKKLHLSANRKYKDTVFRMLFADKSNLLSLYNAMSGSDYHDPSKLQIITLENAIYIGMKNDLAFVIGTNLFLYEHQSTYNPNVPLRNLFYISSEYQKMVDSNKLIKIFNFLFYTRYNGNCLFCSKSSVDEVILHVYNY